MIFRGTFWAIFWKIRKYRPLCGICGKKFGCLADVPKNHFYVSRRIFQPKNFFEDFGKFSTFRTLGEIFLAGFVKTAFYVPRRHFGVQKFSFKWCDPVHVELENFQRKKSTYWSNDFAFIINITTEKKKTWKTWRSRHDHGINRSHHAKKHGHHGMIMTTFPNSGLTKPICRIFNTVHL